jgi:hypothetical protein
MSEQTPQRPPYESGDPGRQDDCSKPKPDPKPYPDPKPEPTPCPDPCDSPPKYGPPEIPADCCTRPDCCPKPKEGEPPWRCTWDEVDDPCVRASACGPWTKITCKCESSNKDCNCNGWNCASYPQGTCVPCDPCKGLPTPPDDGTNGGPEPPNGKGCGPDALRHRLGAVKKSIQKAQKERDDAAAALKANQDNEKELNGLITSIETLVKTYSETLHKLKCREDCLKGFHRDMTRHFKEKFTEVCLNTLTKAINEELCEAERRRCCVKSLEAQLTCTTKAAWDKQQAEKDLKKAEDAFKAIKDLPGWIGEQFGELEKIRDQIVAALADKDPRKHNHAFYLFYWKFAPGLCKRFPVPLCCCKKDDGAATTPAAAAAAHDTGGTPEPAAHFGCVPGEWHPSRIDIKRLRELVCCALDVVNQRKDALRNATNKIAEITARIEAVKAETPDDKALAEKIRVKLETIECGDSAASR